MYCLRGLTIDNGGSEVRLLPLDGTVKEGMQKMLNDFVRIDRKNFRVKETDDKFGLCDIIKAPKQDYLGILARGTTGKLYNGESIVLSNTKTNNVNYYRQFVYDVARDAVLAHIKGVQENDCVKKKSFFSKVLGLPDESNEVIFDYVITTCIPIKEHSGANDCVAMLKGNLAGEYEVKFPLYSEDIIKFRIRKEYLGVVPEGGVAMTGLRKEVGPDDFSLLVDMGHVTTDLSIFKGTTLYGKVASPQWAGATLIANVRSALADVGCFLSEEEVANTIQTGLVPDGKKDKDVSSIVREQKKMFVQNYLKSEIKQLLNVNALNENQIRNVVPIGAPMNSGSKTGSIVQHIINDCSFENAEVKRLSEDLRYVNVEQASVFTKLLYKKAEQEASEQTA